MLWEERFICVDGKTGPRYVPIIEDDALGALRAYQKLTGYLSGPVFRNRKGGPLTRSTLGFKSAVERAGITRNVRLHDLRHTVGTQLERRVVLQQSSA